MNINMLTLNATTTVLVAVGALILGAVVGYYVFNIFASKSGTNKKIPSASPRYDMSHRA